MRDGGGMWDTNLLYDIGSDVLLCSVGIWVIKSHSKA